MGRIPPHARGEAPLSVNVHAKLTLARITGDAAVRVGSCAQKMDAPEWAGKAIVSQSLGDWGHLNCRILATDDGTGPKVRCFCNDAACLKVRAHPVLAPLCAEGCRDSPFGGVSLSHPYLQAFVVCYGRHCLNTTNYYAS